MPTTNTSVEHTNLYVVPSYPCNASELVHFRHRIGEEGIELILAESIRVNDEDPSGKGDKTALIDSTVQEKNITYPTDSKLHRKIIRKCQRISQKESLPVRQSYTRTLKSLFGDQRFRNHPKNCKKALRADKKIKTIAARLVRELERNLVANSMYSPLISQFFGYCLRKRTVRCLFQPKSIPVFQCKSIP